MGTLFKNIDDLKILKELFPNHCLIEGLEETDYYGDGKQAGRAYSIYGGGFILIPVHSTQTLKSILGEVERECIAWNVHSVHLIPSYDRMEPDEWDEREMLLDASFEDAVAAINSDMFRCEVDNCLEHWEQMSEQAEEEMEPYA